MSIVLQPTLFDIDYLLELDVNERYTEIFSPINFGPILRLFQKDSEVGAPITVNYEACFRAIVVRYIEGIDTMKALVRRLKDDLKFKLSVGFLYSQQVPSEATFSRIFQVLSQDVYSMTVLNEALLHAINDEFAIFEEDIAIDATAIEGHSKPKKTTNPQIDSTIDQRNMSTAAILDSLPVYPSWSGKKNSQGKTTYWFGYKGHYAVSTESQYLLASLFTSAFVADMNIAIPLMRQVASLGLSDCHIMMDKGYDAAAIYEEAHDLSFEPIIDHKKPPEGDGEFDAFFAPTCLLEYGYKYDSFDKRYDALKFVKPETNCRDCPLQHEGMCQKVIKIKQTTDVRRYAHPARGTDAWKRLYKKRSAVERVNAYLKEYFQLNQTRFVRGENAHIESLMIQLAYNASKFASQRLAKKTTQKEIAA